MTYLPPRTLALHEPKRASDLYVEIGSALFSRAIQWACRDEHQPHRHHHDRPRPGSPWATVEAIGQGVAINPRPAPTGHIVRITDGPNLARAIVIAANRYARDGNRDDWTSIAWHAGVALAFITPLRWLPPVWALGDALIRWAAPRAARVDRMICSEASYRIILEACLACLDPEADVVLSTPAELADLDPYQVSPAIPSGRSAVAETTAPLSATLCA